MFNLNLRYLFSVFLLFIFAFCFFSSEFVFPFLRKWKSNQLLNLSKVYHDESISNESNLLEDGVRKARIASLLDPSNRETKENFLKLLFRSKPTDALQIWASIFYDSTSLEEDRMKLLNRSIQTLKNDQIQIHGRRIAGEIAFQQLTHLKNSDGWLDSPTNALITAELLAETGNPFEASQIIRNSLLNHPTHSKSIFLLTRLIVHLKEFKDLSTIGGKLAKLASRKSQTGIEAIRHMTLLHILQPLSNDSLSKCLELLQSNQNAQAIDFMRIHALQYQLTEDHTNRISIIRSCSEQFDLNQPKDLLIFCRWLGRLGAFSDLVQYLSPSKSKVDEELFKLRMNALAQLNDLDSIHFEVSNAPIIPERWRLVIEARAFALEGNYKESIKVLDRLLPILGNDPRLVRSICSYLESANDIQGLTHILNKLIEQPIHQGFALRKLMQYRSASATLEELIGWMTKLSKLHGNDPFFSQTFLYFELLDPLLPTPSRKLDSLILEAKENSKIQDNKQSRITLALAHLRNRSPDQALVSLGPISQWRNWQTSRPAWTFITSQVFSLNHESEKAMILQKSIDFTKLDRAEKESLIQLFPQSFPITQ